MMDDETAKVLFREGATLVFLDLPEGSEFGIDYNSWTVGPKFKGVKMIPPGIHFIYYSSRNGSGSTGMRSGFFHHFKQREILVKKWDAYNEDIKPGIVCEKEKDRLTSNMKELDQYLGPYPYDNYKKWVSLTSHLTADLLTRLQPECGTITSVTQFQSQSSDSKMRLEAELARQEAELTRLKEGNTDERKVKSDSECLPKLDTIPGTELRFSEIPQQRFPEGATPQEVTKHSIDSTYVLETFLNEAHNQNKDGILGEIQFSFISFLIGQVYDAFDQWKKLVHLLCSSTEALNTHTDLFMNFISVLHFQVHEIPEDFFVDIVSSNNFLTTTLYEFFSNLEEGNGESKLRKRGEKFREHLTKKFKWDFTAEPDDYAPVIVDT